MKNLTLKFEMRVGIILMGLLIAGFNSFGQNLSDKYNNNIYTSGEYTSEQVDLSSNEGLKIVQNGTATITVMVDQYLFPSSIDESGERVVIQTFGAGDQSYYWTQDEGLITFPGKGTTVASNGTVVGDFTNNSFPGGGIMETAGLWDIASQEWTFLGVNPLYPTASGDAYTSGWGQSDDGATVVGMQWYDGWSVKAFKWDDTDGYTMIGDQLDNDSRASGISRNGAVIFGWATSNFGYWSPVIWQNDTANLIAGDVSGEVMCASPNGTYVAGKMDDNAFYWSEETGVVNFGGFDDYPTIIMEDGAVFGFNTVFPPTLRTAFYMDPEGNMMSFNDYAESRGMEDAQAWTFYSVNDVTPDGNVFIGAGVNPAGQTVSFHLEFSELVSVSEIEENIFECSPNPATNSIFISVESPSTISILDLNGKLLIEKQIVDNSEIDVESLSSGVYIINSASKNGTTSKKIIKQ